MEAQAEKMIVCFLHISLLWCVCESQISVISQPASFQAVELGHAVTIVCCIESTVRTRVWFKLNTGMRLQQVASTDIFYKLTTYEETSQRYSVKSDHTSSHLTISRTVWEDTGTYYCGVMNLKEIRFGQGTFLMIKGANVISNSVVQQPESKSVQPGDSVTLSCSVHTGHCAAEHTHVTWLKNSDHSALQMIYSSGDTNHSCHSTGSGRTICVYNVLLKNLSSDDAGTFSCVVSSCGQILFGNGTRINIHRDEILIDSADYLSPTVFALMLSNIALGMLTLVLVWMLCKNHKNYPAATSGSISGSLEDYQLQHESVYTTVCSPPRGSSCRQASVKYIQESSQVVYSDVRICNPDQRSCK